MGTLLNQDVRQRLDVDERKMQILYDLLNGFAVSHKISFGDAVSMYRCLVMDRYCDLYVNNGDIFDEQMSGIGEIGNNLVNSLER